VQNRYVQPTNISSSIDVVKKYDGSEFFCAELWWAAAAVLLFLLY
jgi:hypothetical protein